MRLRYAGRCRSCDRELPAGTVAVYERGTRTVLCITCESETLADEAGAAPEIVEGRAGGSARREFERRRAARETRIRGAHPKIGGLILALSDDPQSTKAWATGAIGEEQLGARLDGLTNDSIHILHDRRIPGTTANIDHIVICPSGVFVIDAKKYAGRPALRVEGGFFRPRVEKLLIGSRDRTKLVDGVQKQIDRVIAALGSNGITVPVSGMLCFVGADWPLIGGDFTIASIRVLWPRKAADHILKAGPLDAPTAKRVHYALASAFPAYS